MTWTLVIPGHLARLNELMGGHWRRQRLRKRDDALVAVAAHNAGCPPARGKRRVGLEVTLRPRQRADADCWLKSVLDALVACGALVGDGPHWVEWSAPTQVRGPKAAMRITLEDIHE